MPVTVSRSPFVRAATGSIRSGNGLIVNNQPEWENAPWPAWSTSNIATFLKTRKVEEEEGEEEDDPSSIALYSAS
jgi:hypothetical protein